MTNERLAGLILAATTAEDLQPSAFWLSRTPASQRARVAVWRQLRADGLSDAEIGKATRRHSTTVRQALAPIPKKRPT